MLWVAVLNQGLEWTHPAGVPPAELLRQASAPWSGTAREQLTTDLALLRGLHACAALPRARTPREEGALGSWLPALALGLGALEKRGRFALPPLRARRSPAPLPPALEELLSTALLELLAGGASAAQVGRCQGLLRGAAAPPGPAADEAAFARAAGLEALLEAGFVQCPRLVLAPRGSRYCSKACSNAAFALRKGSAEPRYFAHKQARYRARQSAPARPVPSAFVAFVD
jgi:hypothetical protein